MKMFFKRNWTAAEADDWTKEDWVAIVVSPLAYFFLMVGTALSALLLFPGFVFLAIGIVLTVFMHWVIDPKLKAISDEYEQKQARYIEDLERTTRGRRRMDKGLTMVVGMSIAYGASLLGLLLAWRSYRKHHKPEEK